ncbi:MAG: hypothetical protein ACJ786_13190, partial [Catenulispora sp.]
MLGLHRRTLGVAAAPAPERATEGPEGTVLGSPGAGVVIGALSSGDLGTGVADAGDVKVLGFGTGVGESLTVRAGGASGGAGAGPRAAPDGHRAMV